jgi:amidophosphoribosyltransferase
MGELVSTQVKEKNWDIDVVMPVPDSARSTALQIATSMGVPYREGIVKNRYIGRTFIMPGQNVRKKSIRFKLNTIELEIRDKNILLVEDSIVRGNTAKKIIQLLRESGAKKVYFVSAAPALRFPCVYGIDMPTKQEFVATGLETDEIKNIIGADGLIYQKLDDLITACQPINGEKMEFCTACFNGKYPTEEVTEEKLKHLEDKRLQALSDEDTTDSQLTLV